MDDYDFRRQHGDLKDHKKICPQCGDEFYSKYKTYCTYTCKHKFYTKKKQKRLSTQ